MVLAVRAASTEIQRQYRQALKAMIEPAWREELRGNVTTRLESRVLLETNRVAVSNQNVRLSSATVGRALSKRTGGAGAAKPATLARLVEGYGPPRDMYSTYKRKSKRGGTHTVRRRVMTGFGPRNLKGNVVYPALARIVPRVAALAVQTCVRTLNDAFEGKR